MSITGQTEQSAYHRPQLRLAPSPTAESRPFWTGGEHDELLIYRCQSCGHFFHPPGPACWRCRSTDVAPEPVSGRATVAAYTVNRQAWIPGYEPPYIVAMVTLAEENDVRLISNVVDVSPEQIDIGMPVEVFFEDWTAMSGEDDSRVWLPLFRPVAAA
ncbi:Zn-ribbon domain-containing OB-fold protein [Mycolicibacter kumamotonensis]|uniref:Zn-ribbon domain-containing OB-fold protein n=1 Tax=Mycolicibacter kumamotonensis TaxID=354243 RepID=A0A7K3L6W8_9MYCO|nr:Zn-ribbon domain-containing OB-fold protein [Mycolicibacter kumamotonensis]NDJ87923.1 Zn-ribbon domain-containing OB-fold protein [Mycolicibacter kumamotonensis]